MSTAAIARTFVCSQHKVNYWLRKHGIQKRTISEAVYLKNNPQGDPFSISSPRTKKEAVLFGIGLGLYWGEGNKANKNAVRLGNSDPALIKVFVRFLDRFYGVQKEELKFHLHLFSDIDERIAKRFWIKYLGISQSQFYKSITTKSGSLGTYRTKSTYGVLTVYYGNTKLRNILVDMIKEM